MTELTNISFLHNHFENLVESSLGSVYWKDIKGNYLGTNSEFLKVSAMKSSADIVGKNDAQLCWKNEAEVMRRNDQEIIAKEYSKIYLESAKSPNNSIINYLSYKSPLRSRLGKIIGIFGLSFNIECEKTKIIAINQVSRILSYSDTPLINKEIKEILFFSKFCSLGLTKRQTECLFYLTQGLTFKEIGKKIGISVRTVEHYIEHIKIKLSCSSRSELITKAFYS